MQSSQPTIVILGGGFGGLRIALDLAKDKKFVRTHRILLIDRERQHVFTPLLYEVASAFLAHPEKVNMAALARGTAIPFSLLAQTVFRGRIEIIHETATEINLEEQYVILGKKKQPFTTLVLALGSEPETFGIPGIPEYAHVFRSLDDAIAVHRAIADHLKRRRAGHERRVSVVIGGGGPTGVELAGELSSFCEHACSQFGLRKSDFSITVVEAGNRLLSGLHPKTSQWAIRRIERRGVTVLLDTCVKEVRKDRIIISPRPLREGENADALVCDFGDLHTKEIEADVVIWSAGIRSPSLAKTPGLLLDARGRVDVHDTMQAKSHEYVFAVGDCAALVDPKTNRTLPGLAQVAIFEATVAAANIRARAKGTAFTHYAFPFIAHVIPSGGKYAYGEFGPFRIRGFVGYLLRRLIDLRYFLSILTPRDGFRIWWKGWRMYSNND